MKHLIKITATPWPDGTQTVAMPQANQVFANDSNSICATSRRSIQDTARAVVHVIGQHRTNRDLVTE
ncbi:hypothetical protein L0664_13235 [Octadecabacter sp. G9-8]|uniref:Uncharacterized protein n=1 Tax=Octadecabacter dasysiphoniae TaxID=2909341 RepID=A0ABS9CZ10_9RHOB|nr:hypothetical protein [Octadecabacter dasysiphoniae]MCF2872032.1 hypothetical protein [Octadecabacter dasysiphoniae]